MSVLFLYVSKLSLTCLCYFHHQKSLLNREKIWIFRHWKSKKCLEIKQHNTWVKEGISREVFKYFELNGPDWWGSVVGHHPPK